MSIFNVGKTWVKQRHKPPMTGNGLNPIYLDVSRNGGTPPKPSIQVGISLINNPFWGTPMATETTIYGWLVASTPLKNNYEPVGISIPNKWNSTRKQLMFQSTKQDLSGWWLGHPSEKYESQLG